MPCLTGAWLNESALVCQRRKNQRERCCDRRGELDCASTILVQLHAGQAVVFDVSVFITLHVLDYVAQLVVAS